MEADCEGGGRWEVSFPRFVTLKICFFRGHDIVC